MDIKLREKISGYFKSIYSIDILAVGLITAILLSKLREYINIKKTHGSLEIIQSPNKGLLILIAIIYVYFLIKIIVVLIKDNKEPKIKSTIINNIIFVVKNGFYYKETRKTL